MTEDEVDAMIAPLYTRGQLARDEAWRAFEATLSELRAKLLGEARFIARFSHLATDAEQTLRQSMPSPPHARYSQPLTDPGYSEDDADFERRIAWMRENAVRGGVHGGPE